MGENHSLPKIKSIKLIFENAGAPSSIRYRKMIKTIKIESIDMINRICSIALSLNLLKPLIFFDFVLSINLNLVIQNLSYF